MKQTKTTPTAHIFAEIHGSPSAVEEATNGIFDRFNDAFNCEFNDEDIFLAAVAPDIELCVVREDEANDYLPRYAEADTVEEVPALGLLVCYHPAQVIQLAGRRYLCGTVLFTDVDEYGNTRCTGRTIWSGNRQGSGIDNIYPAAMLCFYFCLTDKPELYRLCIAKTHLSILVMIPPVSFLQYRHNYGLSH